MLQPRTTWRQTSGEVERIERNAGRAGDKSLPNASVVRRDPIAPSPAPEMICRRSKVDAPPPPLLFTPTRPGFYCQTELLQEFALEFTEINIELLQHKAYSCRRNFEWKRKRAFSERLYISCLPSMYNFSGSKYDFFFSIIKKGNRKRRR